MCFSNSVPLLATNNLVLAAYGNVVSNISLFFLIYYSFKVQLIATDKFLKNNIASLNILLFVVAIISIGFQINYLNIPEISLLDISWNLNGITMTLLTSTIFIFGTYWAWVFGGIAHILRDPFLKKRMYMISANGLGLGFSGLFLFQSNMSYTIIGILLLFITALANGIVFFTPEHSKNSKSELATV